MNEPINTSSIEIELTKQDIVDLHFSLLRRNCTLWILLLVGVLFLTLIVMQIRQGKPFEDYWYYLFFLLFIVLIPSLTYIGARKSYDNKFVQEKKTYVFSSEGFRMESESASVNTHWSDIKKVVKTRNGVSLFVGSNAAHILPHRYLSAHEEINTMIEQLTSKESRKAGKSKIATPAEV